MEKNRLSILTPFSSVFLFLCPLETLGFLTLGRNGLNYKLLALIFTKFKKSFFEGALSVITSGFLNGLQGNPIVIARYQLTGIIIVWKRVHNGVQFK